MNIFSRRRLILTLGILISYLLGFSILIYSAEHLEAFISFCAPTSGIAIIDIPSRQLIQTISLDGIGVSDWLFGSPDNKYIYFVTGASLLARLEVVSKNIQYYTVPGLSNVCLVRPGICSKDGKTIFLINRGPTHASLFYINTDTFQVYKEIDLSNIIEDYGLTIAPEGLLDISPDGNTIFVSDYNAQVRVGAFDIASGTLINKTWIAPGGYNRLQDFEIAPSGEYALITTCMFGEGMVKLNLHTYEYERLGIYGQGEIRFFDDSKRAFIFPKLASGGDMALKIFNAETKLFEPMTFLARAFSGAPPQGKFTANHDLFVYYDSARTYTVPPAKICFLNPLDYSLSYIIPGMEFCGSMVIAEYSDVIDVSIDIKPGSFPNSINLGSNGNIPVSIFSTLSFDARTIDPASVTLAGASVLLRGKSNWLYIIEDINNDGLEDMIVHIDTTALQLSVGDIDAVLEACTISGVKIRGTDSVRIVQ